LPLPLSAAVCSARVGNITPTAAEDFYMIALWLAWFRLVAVLHAFSSDGPLLRIFEVMILQDVGIFVMLASVFCCTAVRRKLESPLQWKREWCREPR
jgi:hypothetical protein